MTARSLVVRRLLIGTATALAFAFTVSLAAQIPTRNVNMVSGLEWPGGDPFMQRQNEPSIAASTRNPMHLLAGANDYRSVDLPLVLSDVDGEVGDAWVGLFKSTDGGERWSSTLVPGHPHDRTVEGQASPLFGYHAAADPVVRAGTNGLMYYAGLAFDRSPTGPHGKSAIFVARFIDNNNQEAGDPFRYINTTLVSASPGGETNVFLDKPWMAVDIPRSGGGTCTITTTNEHGPFTQRLPAGNVYVAFTVKSADAQGDRWDLYFSRSADCGERFSAPVRVSRPEDRVNQGATIVIAPNSGEVFVAWRRIDLAADGVEEHAIVVARSGDQGNKWNPPGVARRFPRGKKVGLDPNHFTNKGKKNTVGDQSVVVELSPFDQGTSAANQAFRTNAYPTMSADAAGRLYLAWTERGFAAHPDRGDPVSGDARILLATSTDGATWSAPAVVSDYQQQGHQIMPAISFAGGKLMLAYYDLQEDRSTVFDKYVDDLTAFLTRIQRGDPPRRHTIDIRVAMASPGAAPVFEPSRSVSSYMYGARSSSGPREQLQANPPNLPMFKLGTVPFIGDYIDIAPSPAFVPNGAGGWAYNTAPTATPPVFHVAWTDNRDVKPPPLGANGVRDWTKYTPPTYSGERPDPGASVIVCDAGYAGNRNQNIYSARVTGGLIVGAPQNSKQLNTTFARAFVVFARNTTDRIEPRVFRMTILNQPAGGRASFSQFPAPPFDAASPPPLASIDVTIPRFTTASRTVYVTSTDPHAPVTVDVSEIPYVGAPGEVAGGLEGTIHLNADVLNPEVDNPEVDNPEVDNPEVDNGEVYNPEVDNPEVDNPEVDNPEVDNPEVDNPEVDNIVVGNPEVDNPEVDNPEVDNPEVDNPEVDNPEVDNTAIVEGGGIITDVTWKIRNIGNTTTAYNVNVFLRRSTPPSTGTAQLLIYRIYKTPVITFASCSVQTTTQNVLQANVPSPRIVLPGGTPSEANDADEDNATLWIEPEGEIRVTLRISDPIAADNIIVDGASIDPEWVPERDVSLVLQPQPVNTPDIPLGVFEPELFTADPLPVLTVTSTADSGAGSLREAITLANTRPGIDTIAFNLPGANPHTITPLNTLPHFTEAAIIDGSTQPGYAGVPVVVLDGSSTGGGSAIYLDAGGTTVRALVLNNWGDVGVNINNAGGNLIVGNYIGVDVTGAAAASNGTGGITVDTDDNIIGTLDPLDRNVISGNAFWGVAITGNGNRVEGNYIGLDAAGAARIDNLVGVIVGGADNIVGGNTISGNFLDGVRIDGPSNTVEKNKIGTNAAGTVAVFNPRGVRITGGVGNRIIDNLISGNTADGILVTNGPGVDPAGTDISGNLIGTDATGSFAVPNNFGITLDGVSDTTIGGAGAARNVISGNVVDGIYVGTNSTLNTVKGNYIGLNAAGAAALGNGYMGVSVYGSSNNTVGSVVPEEANVISGNAGGGVLIGAGTTANDNLVIGNRIGTSTAGLAAIPNGGHGVTVAAAGEGILANNRIGGTLAAERNIISGNTAHGVLVIGGPTVTGTIVQGNLIGVGADGAIDLGNGGSGVLLNGAPGTLIGGNQATARNVVSGNAATGISVANSANVVIAGNYVGVAADGSTAVANTGGILIGAGSPNVTVGGAAGFGNVVSGNIGVGVNLSGVGTIATNNFVGTDAAGMVAVPNTTAGFDVFGDSNQIGQAGAGNLASGNINSAGIRIRGWSNIVQGNKVGTNVLGTAAIPNGGGIVTQNRPDVIVDAVIGGEGVGEGNLVSGNIGVAIGLSQGLVNPDLLNPEIGNPPPWFVEVKGNIIGPAANGVDVLGNGAHGFSAAGVSEAVVGGATPASSNLIAYNTLGGIAPLDNSRVTIERNEIFGNGGLSIDIDNNGVTPNDPLDADGGANLRQNFPQLNAVVGPGEVNGELFAAPDTNYVVRVFSGLASGQPRTFQGLVAIVTDGGGHAFFTLPGLALVNGHWVMATATDSAGNTSELSPSVLVNVP